MTKLEIKRLNIQLKTIFVFNPKTPLLFQPKFDLKWGIQRESTDKEKHYPRFCSIDLSPFFPGVQTIFWGVMDIVSLFSITRN